MNTACSTLWRLLALPFTIACVPASEELPPAGAAGFTTEPSEATRGEPFVTRDGWTVTIERLVLQTAVAATTVERGYGGYYVYLFDAKERAALYVPGLPVGAAHLDFDLHAQFPFPGDSNPYEGTIVPLVDDETQRRFAPPPAEGTLMRAGISMLLVARAERDGESFRIDAGFYASRATADTSPFGSASGIPVDVREDALVAMPLPLRAEALLDELDPIAKADRDGDGVIVGAEIDDAADVRSNFGRRVAAMFGRNAR